MRLNGPILTLLKETLIKLCSPINLWILNFSSPKIKSSQGSKYYSNLDPIVSDLEMIFLECISLKGRKRHFYSTQKCHTVACQWREKFQAIVVRIDLRTQSTNYKSIIFVGLCEWLVFLALIGWKHQKILPCRFFLRDGR